MIRIQADDSIENIRKPLGIRDMEVVLSVEKWVLDEETPLSRAQDEELGPRVLQEWGLVRRRELKRSQALV